MKTAKIFKDGQSQAVQLPKEFKVDGDEVYIKRVGKSIVLIPMKTNLWESMQRGIEQFSDDFMSERSQP